MAESVGRFVLRTFLLLPVCFAIWYFAREWVVFPAYLLSLLGAKTFFADVFSNLEHAGSAITFVTTLRPGRASVAVPATGIVTFDVNALIYTYGLPLVAALTLAARESRWWLRLAACAAALVPFQAWGILADGVQTVAGGLGPDVASQTGFSSAQREAIAFAYQFGHLVLPAVAPAVAWVIAHRGFLQRIAERPDTEGHRPGGS